MPRSTLSSEAIAHANEYQKSKFSILSTSVPRTTADHFREWCKSNGTTVHAELKKFIESELKKAEG